MKTIRNIPLGALLVLSVILQACSPATVAPPAATQPPSKGPAAALPTETLLAAAEATGTQPAPTLPPPTEAPSSTPIQHTAIPGTVSFIQNQVAQDCSMGYTYEAGQPASIIKPCDAWSINYLERPLANRSLNYLPFLDIESAQFGADALWYYGRIRLHESGLPGDGQPLFYLFELDTNFDGRGNILISVENLPLTDTAWTVAGVRAWKDTNTDVGSQTPIRADAARSGDGYDTLLFDQGAGPDPDLAWARRSPEAENSVEFAFKPALLDNDNTFSWWAWALLGGLEVSQFDLVDGATEAYQVDNTCTVGFNGDPMGFPNQCKSMLPSATSTPESPGCVQPPKPNRDYYWDPVNCKWMQYN